MKILILEDNPERHKIFRRTLSIRNTVVIVTSVAKAKVHFNMAEISGTPFEMIFIDHDLDDKVYVDSEEENTGYQFAKFLAGKVHGVKLVTHSMNPVGAKNIQKVLPQCDHVPFSILMNTLEEGLIS